MIVLVEAVVPGCGNEYFYEKKLPPYLYTFVSIKTNVIQECIKFLLRFILAMYVKRNQQSIAIYGSCIFFKSVASSFTSVTKSKISPVSWGKM